MRWTAPLIAIVATLLAGSFLFWALGKPSSPPSTSSSSSR
jgi:hypothetical protein